MDSVFNGEIPPHLGNLSNLQYLYIRQSLFDVEMNIFRVKSLKWITGLASLKALDLSGNNFSECLDWLDSVNMLPSLSSLNLRASHLEGATVSPPLSQFNLTSLVSLDIGQNYLDSALSMLRFFNLTSSKLEVLRIDGNHLQGPIPFMLEKSISLTVLDLSFNLFDSSLMLDSLCNITNLVYVNLQHNQLGGSLPLCFGNLTSLVEINLRENKFSGNIPTELGNLKQLTHLQLSSNYFNSCIPSTFGQLPNLQILYLNHNQLYGTVPSNLGQLSNLVELDVSYNSLAGELSELHFLKLTSLKGLFISNNQLLTLNVSSQWNPPFLLRWLDMGSVQIGTQFPPWLQTQTDLYLLSLSNARISSAIPEWFERICSGLTSLDLSFNFLTHTPNSLGTACSNLQILDLSSNMIHGSLGDNSLCNLSSLMVLDLANNQLTGSIPPCLGNRTFLGVLNLANNSFSGQLPDTFGNLQQLRYLHLNRNNFSGLLPSSLKNLKGLITLDLGENQLQDVIPDWIGRELSSLVFLRLESNEFYGNISSSLCQFPSLQILNLARNNLGGSIPHCLGNLSGMLKSHQDYEHFVPWYSEGISNMIHGLELEYTSSNIGFVKSMLLSGNHLDGEIPDELMDLDGLQSLNLSNNNLSGKIPDKIDNLTQLESLDLSMNQLSGSIPQSLASIDALSYLNLSFNNLEGGIPSGNHFDTLNDPSIYEGNGGLCGKPLTKRCSGDDSPSKENGPDHYVSGKRIDDDSDFELLWFYAGIGPGFAVGFLGVFCVLLYRKSWRYAYFQFLENVYNRIWIVCFVKIPQFKWRFN